MFLVYPQAKFIPVATQGDIILSEFKAVMLASLRSLVPKEIRTQIIGEVLMVPYMEVSPSTNGDLVGFKWDFIGFKW